MGQNWEQEFSFPSSLDVVEFVCEWLICFSIWKLEYASVFFWTNLDVALQILN
jgi:hypothetical protein